MKTKQLLLAFLLFGTMQAIAQKFTIEKTVQPFYDIIEWKGMGALLLSKDPTGNNNQLYMTLVSDQPKSIWEQQIAPPKGINYYFVSSENARYVYFIRNLNPENGKIYFEQLNSAGNVKSTSVSFTSVIKNLGFDVSELELKNVVVTDKALVHHFRHLNKKEKNYTDIATFMTHNNMLVYATVLGTSTEADISSGKSNQFQYIGFTGDTIGFADYSTKKEGKGWNIIQFNSKGKEINRFFLKNKIENTIPFVTNGYGTNGAYYRDSEKEIQNGLISYHNGSYYITTLSSIESKLHIDIYRYVDGEMKKINSSSLPTTKKAISIGIYPLNEAMTYRIKGGEGDQIIALFLDGTTAISHSFSNESIYNPSRSIIKDQTGKFAVHLSTGNLFFDKQQFKSSTSMEFEFIKK